MNIDHKKLFIVFGALATVVIFGLLIMLGSGSSHSKSDTNSVNSSSEKKYAKMPKLVGKNLADGGNLKWINDNELMYSLDNDDFSDSIDLTLKNTNTNVSISKKDAGQYKIASQSIKAGKKLEFGKEYKVDVTFEKDDAAIASSQAEAESKASSERMASEKKAMETPIDMTPDQMLNAYDSDQLVVGQKYKLTGVVANDVTTEYLYIETSDGQSMSFEASSQAKIKKFKKGMTVNLVAKGSSNLLPEIVSVSQDKSKPYDEDAALKDKLESVKNEVNQTAGMEIITSYDVANGNTVYMQLNPDVLIQSKTQLKVMLDNVHSIMIGDGVQDYTVFMVGDSRIARTTVFSGVKIYD